MHNLIHSSMPRYNYKGKIVAITGGSNGIGCALGMLFAKKGSRVFSLDVVPPKEPPQGISFIKTDVTNSRQIKRAFQKIGGKVDIVVNNAGIMRRGEIFDSNEKDWDDLFRVNVKGYWLVLKTAQRVLKENAHILFISSVHGVELPKNPALYGLTKKAVFALAEIIGFTYPRYKIKIIAPGPIATSMSKAGRTKAEYEKRRVHQEQPEQLCERICALIDSNHTQLLYSSRTSSYFFK